jgi:MYXO-CTERM domain-containing protein
MKTITSISIAFGAAALGLTSAPALAQNTADPAATTTYPAPQPTDDDDDGDAGKWGLLGLLGLAGLLGLKRRDHDHHDHRQTNTGGGTSTRM